MLVKLPNRVLDNVEVGYAKVDTVVHVIEAMKLSYLWKL